MSKITIQSVSDTSGIELSLVKAVVKQFGGWQSFKESAPDVTKYGIAGGFGNFVYYYDTVRFTERNKQAIFNLAAQQADEFGSKSISEFIANFNCVRLTQFEAEAALCDSTEDTTVVYNALAWFAAEEVCKTYVDLLES